MKGEIGEVLIGERAIKKRVKELAEEISRDYRGKSPLLVGVLRGAIVFLADLMRELTVPVEIDFMAISSYGQATKSSGVVRILKDLDEDIRGRHVLVVEDIVDTGLTLSYLLKSLKARHPASLQVCAFLSKKGKQRVPLEIKYLGFEVPDRFVVGYGLDFAQKYRYFPCIYALKPEICREA
ncbi:MAG: hypoxanthine phosphoribosyltransferase [Actinomycetota bacterium]|nr:hypoxanthine phosphoribosyltransferase [Actinomycetota bacterium]